MTPSETRAALRLTPESFIEMARKGLNPAPSEAIFDARTGRCWRIDDRDIDPRHLAELNAMEIRRTAAVLVPVVMREEPTVLFTLRTEDLPSHAGQIAFPGGSMEPADPDPVAAALREAREEIGLEAHFIEPLGFLDSFRSRAGYHVIPVVAAVRPGFTLRLDPSEVADTFEVPLAFLMDEVNHQQGSRPTDQGIRHFYAMPFGERYIWGITAGMIKNMHSRLTGA